MKKIHFALLLSALSGGCATTADELSSSTDDALTSTRMVTCQSWSYQYATCDVDTQGGAIVGVRVARQLSSPQGACNEGASFGFGDQYLWVDHGCRADFEVILRSSSHGGSHGGDITLFEHDGFGGRSLHLTGETNNFDPIRFNDMVSSLIVRRGTWELCTDAYFQGTCVQYGPGEHSAVGPFLNDKFSSARVVSW